MLTYIICDLFTRKFTEVVSVCLLQQPAQNTSATFTTVFCLPILQYVNGAFRFYQPQIAKLNVYWNSIFRKIFLFNRWESGSQYINVLDYVNFTHMYYIFDFKRVKSALVHLIML